MKYRLQDLIDLEQFQALQDRLNEIYSFPSAIIDNAGNILTATAWQDLCTQFHRRHPQCEEECRQSDRYILSHLHEANPAVTYRCPHGLVDNATPIIIDGVHYGNFFTGQFFLEPPDLEFFRAQARQYGFDEGAYLEAVKKVPIWKQEQLNSYLFFIKGLIVVLSESGLKRLKEMEARSRAEAAEARARTILQTAMDGFWRVDLEGRLLEVNEAYCQMSGYQASELLGRRVSDLEATETPAETARHMEQVIAKGGDRFETKHRRKDGRVFDVEASVQYRPADSGEVVVFLRDITERKQSSERLRQSEAKWRSYIENAPVGVLVADATGRHIEANRTAEEMLGYPPGGLEGTYAQDLPVAEYAAAAAEHFKQVVDHGLASGQFPLRRKGGGHIWGSVRAAKLADDRFLAVIEDITERKRAEAELQRTHGTLVEAQKIAHLGSFEYVAATRTTVWSEEEYRIYGLDPAGSSPAYDEMLAKCIHPDDAALLHESFTKAMQSRSVFELEHRIVRPDGSLRWVHDLARPYLDEQGEIVRYVGTTLDITERKRAEERLRESEEKLRRLVQNLQAGVVVHAPDTHILLANEHACRLLGLTLDQMMGKTAVDPAWHFVREDLSPLPLEHYPVNQVVVTRAPLSDQVVGLNRPATNDQVWAQVSAFPEFDARGRLVQVVVTFVDITERKRTEETLRESEGRLHLALGASQAGIWEWDLWTNTNYWSDQVYRLYELDPQSHSPSYEAWRESIHPDDRAATEAAVQAAVSQGIDLNLEWRVNSATMKGRWLLSRGQAVRDAEGRVTRYRGIVLDITERKRMEEERLRDDEHLEMAQRSAKAGLWDWDILAGRFKWSRELFGLFGLDPDRTAAGLEAWRQAVHPEDREIASERIGRAIKDGTPLASEYRVVLPDGRIRWLHALGNVVYDQDQRPLRMSGICLDTTERKRAEQRLLHFHDLMQHIIAHARSAIAVHDRDLKYVYVSKRYLQEYKLKEQEIIGKHHYEVFPDLPQKWRDVHQRVLAGEVCSAEKDSYPRADGSVEWTRWEVRPWHEADGSIGGLIVYTEVITERVRAEEALRQSEQRFRDITFTLADWIWEVDAEGRYTYASKSVEQVLGVKPEDVVGRTPFDFMPPEEGRRIRAAFLEIAGRKAPFFDLENIACHRDGTVRYLLSSGVPILDEAGGLMGYRGTDKDVTRQRQLELQVRQAQKLEAIGQLAGGVAHDFNNILAAILMHLSMLSQDETLGASQRADLTELVKEAKRGAAITRQLLAFSRRQMMERTVLDLNSLLENHLKMLRRLLGEHIDLTFRGDPAPVWINADAGMMEQVVMNLCVNARDAMPRGGSVTLATSLVEVGQETAARHDSVRPGTFVCVVVQDTGCGMDEATLQRIFEPFFTTKEVGKGTGLGLATVHGIVAQHQGWVEVDSKVGEGATFRVCLPAVQPKLEAGPAKRIDLPLPGGKETILLVEDERTLRKAAAGFLQQQGYGVIQAESGVEALRQWDQHSQRIDLLLSDMVMPEGMTGLELAERLRAQKPELGVIIISGYSLELVDQPRQGAGDIVCLAKPCEAATLSKAVREVLDRTRSSR